MDFYLDQPLGQVGRYMKYQGRKIMVRAKAQVGVKSGALRANIHMRHVRIKRGQYIKIIASLRYARMHHDGTRPHVILPRKRQVLRFMSKGQIINTHMVLHPGTKPNRFLTDQLKMID